MAIVNVTPDSFSDGGRFNNPSEAVAYAHQCVDAGATIIDIGGESTRPGATQVSLDEELTRVIPVVEEVAPQVRVSIDTTKPEVAEAAIAAGATILNDVSASLDHIAAKHQVGWIAMHRQGTPETMQKEPHYTNVVHEVTEYLVTSAQRAQKQGVKEIWIDPGIGFGKTTEHNLMLLSHIDELVAQNIPVVLGVSRKNFLGEILGQSDYAASLHAQHITGGMTFDGGAPNPLDRREASLSAAVWAFMQGISVIRVHDIQETAQVAQIVGVL